MLEKMYEPELRQDPIRRAVTSALVSLGLLDVAKTITVEPEDGVAIVAVPRPDDAAATARVASEPDPLCVRLAVRSDQYG
ncbi:hypothetical protein [Frankia sp. EAN1pec]|uniref:hypothetical protein n=1 Tax=Parafrankia sp. (strain EAN1pec) TaxID=298653 RepID=UPI000311BDB3